MPPLSSNQLERSWQQTVGQEFEKDYMLSLNDFLQAQREAGKSVYPEASEIFAAFEATPFEKVRMIIIGQDPYHGAGQAHGLSFSVKPGISIPPSLRNIYKELHSDLDFQIPTHGNLLSWALQGVLLLNSVLTVEAGVAGSHQGRGWEVFTDAVIAALNEQCKGLVFFLWGSYAQKKGALIDRDKHLVLESPHPSPLSAHRGFFNNRHFSQANQYLLDQDISPIDWQLET